MNSRKNDRNRKEIVTLLDNIQEHFKRLEDYHNIPILELDVILSKTAKLQEKTAVLKYMMQNEEDNSYLNEKQSKNLKPDTKDLSEQASSTKETEEMKPAEGHGILQNPDHVIDTESVAAETEFKKSEPKKEEEQLNEAKKSVDIAKQSTGKGTGKIEDYVDLNARFSSEDHSLSDQLKKQPIANLLTAIGLNERYLFANQLFNGDMAQFIEEIKKLNSFDSEEKALAYFDNELSDKESWKSSEDLVEAFRLLIQRRFQ